MILAASPKTMGEKSNLVYVIHSSEKKHLEIQQQNLFSVYLFVWKLHRAHCQQFFLRGAISSVEIDNGNRKVCGFSPRWMVWRQKSHL